MNRMILVSIVMAVIVPTMGCGGEGGTSGQEVVTAYQSYLNKLKTCGVVTDGAVSTGGLENYLQYADAEEKAQNKCFHECLASASCAALKEYKCGDSFELSSECWESCDIQPAFTCTDGASIPDDYVCDSEDDCMDGSDEANCPNFFSCGDDHSIPKYFICDGEEDCDDGSDEVGCSNMFQCHNGEKQIPTYWKCNLYENCEDGSDEIGCPAQLICE